MWGGDKGEVNPDAAVKIFESIKDLGDDASVTADESGVSGSVGSDSGNTSE